MSRIKNAFVDPATGEKKTAFIAFLTGGDPDFETSKKHALALAAAGADIIEIGIPFSDPVAEGPVIQRANIRALRSGSTVESMFRLVEELRKEINIPLVFLTYLNPVLNYGYDAFFARCKNAGLDGIIVPDLPYEERGEVHEYTHKHGIDLIPLVAPTSNQRIRTIAAEAEGFVYVVSSMGVTGARSEIETDLTAIIREVKSVTDIPAVVGFGINTPEQAAEIAKIADGVIVGSAIVSVVEKQGDLTTYASKIKVACRK